MDSGATAVPAEKAKPLKVHVLRCRSESCAGLLAFEETNEGFLLGQVLSLAERVGEKRFFPCPKCGGRNLLEEKVYAGKVRVRVCGFEPAS